MKERKSTSSIVKEVFLCLATIVTILLMDRCIEDLYLFYLFDTGKKLVDLWMAFELRMRKLLPVIMMVAFVLWLLIKRGKTDLGLLLPILAVYAAAVIVSLLSDQDLSRFPDMVRYPLTMYLFITMSCSTLKGARRFVRVGTDFFIAIFTVNIIFIFFPQLYGFITGWSPEPDFFLGQKNLTGFPLVIGMFFTLLDEHLNGGKIRLYYFIVLFIISQYKMWCATNLIMGAVFAIYFIFPFVKKAFQKWNLLVFIGFSLFMFILLMWFLEPIMLNFLPLQWFVTKVLKKSINLSQRTYLWQCVIQLALEKPVFGHGLTSSPYMWQDPRWTSEYLCHAHNAWLQTLYEGGIFYVAVVILLFYFSSRILRKCSDRKLCGILCVCIFAIMILMEASIEAWFTWYPVCFLVQLGALACHRCDEISALNNKGTAR